MRRLAVVSLTLALMTTACGTSPNAQPQVPETTTSTQPPIVSTTTQPPATTSTTAPPATSTTTAPSTSTPTTTPVVAPSVLSVAPWFFVDEAGHENRTGPFLLPVHREVPYTLGVGRASLESLFAGPSKAEQDGVPAISTMVPAGVKVLGLTIVDGLATVDLSDQFEGTDDSAVVALRMAQVVFTLTSISHVSEVVFWQEGKAISAQTGDGDLVTRPVSKADYLQFAAAITVETPVYSGAGGSPLHVTGFGAVFEASFNYVLTDGDGLIIAEGQAMTTNGSGWGGFDFTIPYHVDSKQTGALIVWVYSAKDGSRIDIREYPVVLTP